MSSRKRARRAVGGAVRRRYARFRLAAPTIALRAVGGAVAISARLAIGAVLAALSIALALVKIVAAVGAAVVFVLII